MVRYYNQNDNINTGNTYSNSDNDNKNGLNTYKEKQEQVKTYRYCWKCLRDFSEPLVMPFCDQRCMNEYYHEITREENACYREWTGMD